MEDIIKNLESCIASIENITSISSNSKNFQYGYAESELFKRIEDGILDSIHLANNHQLNFMLNGGYKFRFYTDLNVDENLRSEIQSRLREKKLNKIGI